MTLRYFNYSEFATIRQNSGANYFKISVQEWIERTNTIGITDNRERYRGGTLAHREIAFNFGILLKNKE